MGFIITMSVLGLFTLIAVISGLVITKQKEVSVIERFGKFKGLRRSGLTTKVPFIDREI